MGWGVGCQASMRDASLPLRAFIIFLIYGHFQMLVTTNKSIPLEFDSPRFYRMIALFVRG